MPVGIEVINTANTMLVDSANPCLAMRVKALITSSGQQFPAVQLANAEMPAFAFTCIQPCYLWNASWSGSTRIFNLNIKYGEPATQATAYIFDRPVSSGSNYGIQVFDAAGVLTFDALSKYGRVVAVLTANGSWAGTAGRTYAVMITSTIRKDEILLDSNPSNRIRRFSMTGARVSGTTVYLEETIVSQVIYASSDTPAVLYNLGSPSALVLDVTGY